MIADHGIVLWCILCLFSRSMLYNGSDVIRDLEWVIFDEVHYINDAEVRYATIEGGFQGSTFTI